MGREKASAMAGNKIGRWRPACASVAVLGIAVAAAHSATPAVRACQRVEFQGEVVAGQEWKATFGRGWVFRVLPIAPLSAAHSGWDLAVDRDPPAGYPDALLLATLPYNSINQREIGTTFGLRAQDALGWNPRTFRFMTNPRDFREAQSTFLRLFRAQKDSTAGRQSGAIPRLLELEKRASTGQLRILDARLVPGTADPQPFAQGWAVAFSRTQHEIEPVAAGQASPRGKLVWMRFAVTLWLPAGWNFPSGTKAVSAPCRE